MMLFSLINSYYQVTGFCSPFPNSYPQVTCFQIAWDGNI